ncbi:MAG TPA: Gfo/Idh/MocA family oxidoreductase [Candidatus Avipropionibacterium avicola]|uniref:Gfo/Idh/MocA family oxidoreductase n=1 Tax=Candidatus Avipropionibacterium avicola TaxID=2840701 RepID=A0A9D1KMK5_9ACTN|nr:Gfo/Idh/MocA family oxidoreductase [Candidatus Avipropionibacterium avicola]
MNSPANGPIDVILVGVGHRTVTYARYAQTRPDEMRVVAVVDPDPVRREQVSEQFGIAEDRRYEWIADLPAEQLGRAAINGTMDDIHVETSLELLERGYDLLLEKPISLEAATMMQLQRRADELGRTVVVCHVLRHAPFYSAIKERLAAGEIGEVVTVDMAEMVAYDHMATSYVRGRWRSEESCGSSFLMAKSCHDMDLMSWFAQPAAPVKATSTGARKFFTEQNAPEGSGSRCLVDCQIESTCPFSARRIHVEQNRHTFYAWEPLEHLGRPPTTEEKLESLRTDNPYGRCVWRCDNDVADRQSVAVEFDNGSTGNLTLVGTAAKGDRTVHIVGTRGEIIGSLHEQSFVLRRFDAGPQPYTEEVVSTVPVDDGQYASHGHGGGDLRLVEDFVKVLNGGTPTLSTTSLADSVNGHLAGFAAEQGRLEGRWVELSELRS